jgi:hypothetical protein
MPLLVRGHEVLDGHDLSPGLQQVHDCHLGLVHEQPVVRWLVLVVVQVDGVHAEGEVVGHPLLDVPLLIPGNQEQGQGL